MTRSIPYSVTFTINSMEFYFYKYKKNPFPSVKKGYIGKPRKK